MGSRFALAASLAVLAGACGDAGSGPAAMQGVSDAQSPEAEDMAESGPVDSSMLPAPDAVSEGSSGMDAALEGSGATDAAGDAAQPTCGPTPARYTLLTGADAGLVRDNATMLVWMRDDHGAGEPPQTQAQAAAYCAGRGMRLPTEDEAIALATNYAACAFSHWQTWTSTAAPAAGDAWVVDYAGDVSPQVADNFPSAVLCVRQPAG